MSCLWCLDLISERRYQATRLKLEQWKNVLTLIICSSSQGFSSQNCSLSVQFYQLFSSFSESAPETGALIKLQRYLRSPPSQENVGEFSKICSTLSLFTVKFCLICCLIQSYSETNFITFQKFKQNRNNPNKSDSPPPWFS